MRGLGGIGVLVLLVLLVAACRGAQDQPPLPDKPATVEVALDEYAFAYQPPVPAGRVVFEAHNRRRGPPAHPRRPARRRGSG